ncbi:hypothetical protein PXO_05802 [Xanthomonas oryzae pv. oryzae PXO99A]|uniref:Uncharacterized protein n=1 Tax=Xanthomonas oryzae pv. oryzae (strain PXO99A) TaxID=360094 RepID=A0A0K0GFI1_XANOP|nr:hypothetical protein PXO_05802 [Xanthomonas oryzae pv. oryzae PXO99A]
MSAASQSAKRVVQASVSCLHLASSRSQCSNARLQSLRRSCMRSQRRALS